MAKKITVELVDDLDGSQTAVELVTFGLDGVTYEMDLSAKNAEKLRGDLKNYIENARRVGKAPVKKNFRGPAREDLDQIREWAKKNGKQIADRGRIAQGLVAEYDAAMAAPAPKKEPAPETASAPASRPRRPAKKETETNDTQVPAFSG